MVELGGRGRIPAAGAGFVARSETARAPGVAGETEASRWVAVEAVLAPGDAPDALLEEGLLARITAEAVL